MKIKLQPLIVLATALLVLSCAHKGSLSGGKKDIIPPKVVGMQPPNGSTNFSGKRFSVEFNEFIQLDNINQKALISPPVEEAPDYVLRGKSMLVKFNEELKPNTTYSLYFGDAITDLNEKNPLTNFTYIFSTGDYVDSLSIHGEVIDAFNLSPVEETLIMLYKDNNDSIPFDSLPYLVKPYYISKTDVNGRFYLHGLSGDNYLAFALKDLNGSYTYDQPGESIAFLDHLIQPEYTPPDKESSSPSDSLVMPIDSTALPLIPSKNSLADSLAADSLAWEQQAGTNHKMYLFTEYDSTQKLLKLDVLRKDVIQFSFAQPADDIRFLPQNDSISPSYLEKISRNRDTLIWYVHDYPLDTLELILLHQSDTIEHLYIKTDPDKTSRQARRRTIEPTAEEKKYLKMKANTKAGKLPLNSRLSLHFDYPVSATYTDSLLLVVDMDSIYNPSFQFSDSLKMELFFEQPTMEETKYALVVPDSCFTDWNGLHNEALSLRFSTNPLKYYGVLHMKLVSETGQAYVLQMLNEKEVLVKETPFSGDTSFTFNYIEPGKYVFKLVVDDNANGKWDAGNYHNKIQAEKVLYYSKTLNIRGNWEIEEEWVIPGSKN